MSRAIKQTVIILIGLLLLAAGLAVFAELQRQTLIKQSQVLKTEKSELKAETSRLRKSIKVLEEEKSQLSSQIASKDQELTKKNSEISAAQRQAKAAKDEVDRIQSRLDRASREKDDWKKRLEDLRRERDRLQKELHDRPEKVVTKEIIKEVPIPSAASVAQPAPVMAKGGSGETTVVLSANAENEEYWAGILRQKADLELRIDELEKAVDKKALEMVDLKKSNSDLKVELSTARNERDAIIRKIKHGEDLSHNLSIELARARNDKKYAEDGLKKVRNQNEKLHGQIKQLTTTKLALEKSITRLTEDKKSIEKKLLETESVIQGRIDEIWQIKEDLDRRLNSLPSSGSNNVELPPIIVNASQGPAKSPVTSRVSGASIVSINQANNFVIINVGKNQGSKVGDRYTVYRGGQTIGTLEVIQVRGQISAADIKSSSESLRVGDAIRK